MYNYQLLNNHYIVDIDGKRFLIDTGSESFWISGPMDYVTIDGAEYPLKPNQLDSEAEAKTFDLVGVPLDGFIGLDIIIRTSLTIYKDGRLEFRPTSVEDGLKVPLVGYGMLQVNASSNGIKGKMVIDTGAKYGYGIKELFLGETPYARKVHDFNPKLRDMYSDMHHQVVNVSGKSAIVDMGYNKGTEHFPLYGDIIMIANVTNLFEEVCVIDIPNRLLILK